MYTKVFINDIIEAITDEYVSITDNLLKIIYKNDIARAKRIFKRLLDQTIHHFCDYLPLVMHITNSSGEFTFKDNFKEYVEGKIPEEDLMLIPLAIASISQGGVTYSTKNLWSYDHRSGKISGASGTITYYANYPYVLNNGSKDSWLFSNDSFVYGITDYDAFENRLAYEILLHITRNRNLIQLPTGANMLNFESSLTILQDAIDMDEKYAPALFETWSTHLDPGTSSSTSTLYRWRYGDD